MTSRKDMMEYTMYAIQNQIPKDQLSQIFLQRNITIDQYYIKQIFVLRTLYAQVVNLYNSTSKTNEFIKAVKKFAITSKFQRSPYQQLNDFYSTFLSAVDYMIQPERSRVINHSLRLTFQSANYEIRLLF